MHVYVSGVPASLSQSSRCAPEAGTAKLVLRDPCILRFVPQSSFLAWHMLGGRNHLAASGTTLAAVSAPCNGHAGA